MSGRWYTVVTTTTTTVTTVKQWDSEMVVFTNPVGATAAADGDGGAEGQGG